MRKRMGCALTLLLLGCQRPTTPTEPDAVVYAGGRVWRDGRFEAGAVRVSGNRITDVADDAAALEGKRVELGGAAVLPGLVDAHFHLRELGALDRQVQLKGTRSKAEVLERVAAAAKAQAPGTWIRGRGWDQNDWPEKVFPTAADLDAVAPDHLVWLKPVGGHGIWVNTKVLRAAGVDASTKDPVGGEIIRDARGAPSGVFIDNAVTLLAGLVPAPTDDEVLADLQAGIARCVRVGLTGVHDMGVTPQVLRVLQRLEREGRLPLRVTAYLYGEWPELEPLLAAPPDRSGLLRVAGVKLYADGALGSRGAALLAPYSDRPESRGLLSRPTEQLNEIVAKIHRAGYQLAVHAIGDHGVRATLDAFAAAQGSDRSRRHRVEHVQVVDPADFPRFAALGVVASVQPTHATSDMPWAEARLGPTRVRGAYAWRALVQAGAALALGSDTPVEEESPWGGLYAALTRMDQSGAPAGGWYADQALTLREAIEGFTAGPAFATSDVELGSLRPGALADLTIAQLDAGAGPAALLRARTVRTIIDGREVFAGP